MSRMEKLSVASRFVILSAIVTLLTVAVRIKPAGARPCQEVAVNFFTDANCTQWVGERFVMCNGEFLDGSWGPCSKTYFGNCCDCVSCQPEGTETGCACV